jgi:hypothetical protein
MGMAILLFGGALMVGFSVIITAYILDWRNRRDEKESEKTG